MKAVHYQKEEIDGYTHFYHYDELNRVKEVEMTTDNDVHRSTEARYQYYDYGPLARVELGEHQVQGMDYAYTINGWIKGMNSNTLDPGRDMGNDSRIGYLAQNEEVHRNFAKDVFGFTVNYFDGDYLAVGGSSFEAGYSGTALGNYNQDLYNGNIRHVVTAIEGMDIQGYGYKYDQLQRLKEMQVFRDNNLKTNNNWNTSQATDDYLTKFSYDKNGNLLTLDRNGYGNELDMDRFAYNYLTINGEKSNRLDYVNDTGTDYASYYDIKTGQSTGNYTYNRIGELIEDDQENMKLHWRYGDHKLQKIERTDQDSPEVEFFYNPLGLRVGKLVKERQNGQLEPQDTWTYYYYAYDANGQLMAVYDSKLYAANGETILEEQYIYGSDRIGVIKQGLTVFEDSAVNVSNNPYVENTLGQKRYELKNYLGTVNVTVSDRKTYDNVEDIYEATVTNYAETYPFGMLMPGRSHNADGQRYLYHGMEQDMEVSGSGNSYTTEFRQYDPRLGRWKSLDALMHMFPHLSPYVGFDNNPIYFVDPYGLSSEKGDGGGGDSGGDGSGGDYTRDDSSSSHDREGPRFSDPIEGESGVGKIQEYGDIQILAENRKNGGDGEKKTRKERLEGRRDKLDARYTKISLPIEKKILYSINSWRKRRLKRRTKKINKKLDKMKRASRKKGGVNPSTKGSFPGGPLNIPNTEGNTPEGQVPSTQPSQRPIPLGLQNTTNDLGEGPVADEDSPAGQLDATAYQQWARFARDNPNATINVWGGGNTIEQRVQSGNQIRSRLENSGVPSSQINVFSPTGPVPNAVGPLGGSVIW